MADTEILDLELIKKRAIGGVVTLTLRTFFVQAFAFFATFILTILLSPSIFGIFFLVSALLNFLVYFSDIGLAAALIQKKEKPTNADLKTTFTIQQIIILCLVSTGLLFSGKIASFYNLDAQGLMLLRILVVSLFFSSLKTIPSILLERNLSFSRLVIPQIAENLIFYTVAVTLALMNFGISSFTWAVLARGTVGLVLIYFLSPWIPKIGFAKDSAKKLISFGLPFQANSLLALLKDDLLTVFLGKILTFSEIGYVGWAQKWAFVPLRFFMDNVNKVIFPAYSRLQEHKEELGKAIEKSLFFVTYFVYPSAFGLVAVIPNLVRIIPNYQKWEPAIPLLYFFAINSIFSAVSTTFTNALFATGRPKIVLTLMTFWTFLIWVFTYPLVKAFGYNGVGIASAIVAATSIATVYFVKKEVNVKIGRNIFGPLIISIMMFIFVKSFLNILPQNIFGLLLAVTAGAIIYFVASFIMLGRHLLEDSMTIVKAIFTKSK